MVHFDEIGRAQRTRWQAAGRACNSHPLGLLLAIWIACSVACQVPQQGADFDASRGAEATGGVCSQDGRGESLASLPWGEEGPPKFLEALVASYEQASARYASNGIALEQQLLEVSVRGVRQGWVEESHLPDLIAALDDERPCMGVRMERSSFLHFGAPSSVGNEARFMIEAFRHEEQGTAYRGYPPALSSLTPPAAGSSTRDLREWWRARMVLRGIP